MRPRGRARSAGTFLSVFKNEKESKQAVGFRTEDEAYVLVLDPAGSIEYKLHGAPDAVSVRDVNNHVTEILDKSNSSKYD
jgi:hypothetical protein